MNAAGLFEDVVGVCDIQKGTGEVTITAQKMISSIKDFSSKCDQIRSFLRIWSHLLKKALMETSLFVQCMSARKVFKICHSHEYVKDCNTSLVSSVTEYESKFLLFLLLIFSLMMRVLILS